MRERKKTTKNGEKRRDASMATGKQCDEHDERKKRKDEAKNERKMNFTEQVNMHGTS